jgi:hypothetical protein
MELIRLDLSAAMRAAHRPALPRSTAIVCARATAASDDRQWFRLNEPADCPDELVVIEGLCKHGIRHDAGSLRGPRHHDSRNRS